MIADKIPRKSTINIFILFSIIFSASFIYANTWVILALIYSIFGFLQGGYVTISCAMIMDITNPKVGATQFSVITGLGNFGMLTGETLSGKLITIFGFTRTFLYSAWVFGPALIILYFVKSKKIVIS